MDPRRKEQCAVASQNSQEAEKAGKENDFTESE